MKSFEHGGNIYKAMRQSGKGMDAFLDFSANINPLGLADSLREAIIQNIAGIVNYPDTDALALKEAIADFYKVALPAITVGNGADELLYLLCNALRPQRVLVFAPTFCEYERAAHAAGAQVDYLHLREQAGFVPDLHDVKQQMAAADVVFICNPNNPTGVLLSSADIESILNAAQKINKMVLVDESFQDFIPEEQKYTVRHLLPKYDNLIVLRSLTKFFAMPGLRLGFVLGSLQITNRLHQIKAPWNVNSLAQAAGVAVLQDQPYQQQTRKMVAQAKDQLYQELARLPGIKPYFPTVNYILVNITGTGLPASEIKRRMFEQGILIRDCSNYTGLSDAYLRVAVKLPEANKRLLAALQKVIAGD